MLGSRANRKRYRGGMKSVAARLVRRDALRWMGAAVGSGLLSIRNGDRFSELAELEGVDLVFVRGAEQTLADQLDFFFGSRTTLRASRGVEIARLIGPHARVVTLDESDQSLGDFLHYGGSREHDVRCERVREWGPQVEQAEVLQWVFDEVDWPKCQARLAAREATRRVVVSRA